MRAILALISKRLDKQHRPELGETLPARWVELIHHLNAMERCARASGGGRAGSI
jgi:hypothetical protein